ncbi:carbonate dehydratase [bacterium]|nr:carbonate dehydratase [bacterium]
MKELKALFDNNKKWVKAHLEQDAGFFKKLAKQQTPVYLWIGCADSRMPPNEIVGLNPGELFVHRNVANVVLHTDMNCLSVIQYAVEALKVRHIIVCGHYGCGGVKAAMGNKQMGLIDNWLRHIKDIYFLHREELQKIKNPTQRYHRLAELNVREQVLNVCYTRFVQNAWDRKQKLTVHGWIYDIADGFIKDLGLCINSKKQIEQLYRLQPR